MPTEVRVRFAPSPTGQLHVGNVRTALFNYLWARKHGGSLILRIEDTDLERSRPEFETQLIDDLKWFGLEWDEGPDVGGPNEPYRSSDRLPIYADYANRLLESGFVYPCFCTPEELDAEREAARQTGRLYVYSGRCRNLSPAERQSREARGESSTLRFRVRSGTVQWDDLVRGTIDWDCDLLGDFVIVKTDGWPVYNFAVVVDDLLMEISHVVRGDGHLSNTPRQLLVFEALGVRPPAYAHLSTILGSDGTKLSKRHGATSLTEFKEGGYLPETLFNFLALLGWAPSDGHTELLSREQLLEQFTLDRVSRAPAVFDLDKLNWMNRQYLKTADRARIIELAAERLIRAGRIGAGGGTERFDAWLGDVVDVALGYLDAVGQVVEVTGVVFEFDPGSPSAEALLAELSAEPESLRLIQLLLGKLETPPEVSLADFKRAVAEVKSETGLKGKSLFHPIRIALTLRSTGPELDKLVPIFETGSTLPLPKPIPDIRSRLSMVVEKTAAMAALK
ncbi:MAG: glutamate--tRNA ligase [Acidobacteria bacterium]|nr:glutamate--tRNA ligase [Acidobacteriota bacterium]